jgi:predicted kinase
MRKIILTKGLPASGKTTWAKEMVEKNPGQYKRVNKDDLRAMLDNSQWSKGNERFVLRVRDYIVLQALIDGKSVIVDDTNLSDKHLAKMKELASAFDNVTVEVKNFTDIPLDVCLERDAKREKIERPVGKEVIMQMYNQYLKKEIEQIKYEVTLPSCYIFDIDGTLAIKGNRSPYDWMRVGEDTLNESVARMFAILAEDYAVIVVSGRDEVCRDITTTWLHENNLDYHKLYMRPEGDMRKDTIVKQEMYENHIKGKYNVLGIFDDRNQVVEMWRNLGLPVFQVADGDF